MMQESTRKAIINKEVETYRKFAVVLESLKSVVSAWDGKCFNKKFTETLDNFLKYGKEERSYCVNAGINSTSYRTFFDISIVCYDDAVKGEPDESGYCGIYHINNSNCTMRMDGEKTTTKTDSGKHRINANAVIEMFDEKIHFLNEKAVELEKSLDDVETMRADMEQIKHLMAVFNGKYHGRIKEVFRCNYDLKDCNGMQYR